jgi:hypothetical protein
LTAAPVPPHNTPMRRWAASLSFALAVSLLGAAEARADKVYGAVILDEARKLGEGRYESLKDWEKTLRFFYSAYGKTEGVVFRRIETTPKVNAIHIANLRRGATWEGINIYETRNKVFIYVIKAEPEGAEKKR